MSDDKIDRHIRAAVVYDDAQLLAMGQDSDYLSIDMETVESLLATALQRLARAEAAEAEVERLRDIIVKAEWQFRLVEDELGRSTKATRDGKDLLHPVIFERPSRDGEL